MSLHDLQKQLGISFKNMELLKTAFTHSSYVNEHQKNHISDNERLEFLGDAVLELGISQYLYRQNGHMAEGDLTILLAAIICEAVLFSFGRDLRFGEYIFLVSGHEQTCGSNRPSLLADVFEDFLGALYLDLGFDEVMAF